MSNDELKRGNSPPESTQTGNRLGKTYKSDYRAILSWVVDEIKKGQPINHQKGGMNDFIELMEEARNDKRGNNTSDNFIGW